MTIVFGGLSSDSHITNPDPKEYDRPVRWGGSTSWDEQQRCFVVESYHRNLVILFEDALAESGCD